MGLHWDTCIDQGEERIVLLHFFREIFTWFASQSERAAVPISCGTSFGRYLLDKTAARDFLGLVHRNLIFSSRFIERAAKPISCGTSFGRYLLDKTAAKDFLGLDHRNLILPLAS